MRQSLLFSKMRS